MRPPQSNHNMFCVIHIFSATTTTAEALHFSIQELYYCWMLSPRASKILCSFVQRKFYVAFSCKKKFCVFFHCTMCVIIFFIVQLVQQKYLWWFYVSKRNSAVSFSQIKPKLRYLAIAKHSWTRVRFLTETKAEMLYRTRWYKNCHNFSSLQFLIQNLAGCFTTAIAIVPVIFIFFPCLE